MGTGGRNRPVAAVRHDGGGRGGARHPFGPRGGEQSGAVTADEMLRDSAFPSGWGHLELIYDFTAGGEADGWLHGLFRYEDRTTGHAAETSFGAHIFNTVLTYKSEPQSYGGRPPGRSDGPLLRLGLAF